MKVHARSRHCRCNGRVRKSKFLKQVSRPSWHLLIRTVLVFRSAGGNWCISRVKSRQDRRFLANCIPHCPKHVGGSCSRENLFVGERMEDRSPPGCCRKGGCRACSLQDAACNGGGGGGGSLCPGGRLHPVGLSLRILWKARSKDGQNICLSVLTNQH